MHHRYGRHGPHAWLRQRQRIAEQHLPTVESLAVIICIQVPTNAERVIIIMQNPDDFDPEGEEHTSSLSSSESKLIGPPQAERSNIYSELESKARYEALKRAVSDINRYKCRGKKFPTRECLQSHAGSEAIEAMNYTHFQKGFDIENLRQHYLQAYLLAYKKHLEDVSMNGMLASEEERKIQQIAWNDARRAKQDNVDLSDVELTCHAAIRAQEHLTLDTTTTRYLPHIINYVQIYKRAYREEKDRSSRSGPFSDGCQPSPSPCGCQPPPTHCE